MALTSEERTDDWFRKVERLSELREVIEAGKASAADEIEFRMLWAAYTPQPLPPMPRTYARAQEKLAEIKERLEQELPPEEDNRLRWNFADLIDYTLRMLDLGRWSFDHPERIAQPIPAGDRWRDGVEAVVLPLPVRTSDGTTRAKNLQEPVDRPPSTR